MGFSLDDDAVPGPEGEGEEKEEEEEESKQQQQQQQRQPPKPCTKRVVVVSPRAEASSSSRSPPLSPGGGGDEFEALLGEMQCPICLDCYLDPVSLNCGHTLCREHVFELAAMFHHPDTGLIEFDCPKCREKCKFGSAEAVKVNLEMKNMIALVQRAAHKSSQQRRSERETRLLAQLKKYEDSTKDLRQKEHRLELDRRQLTDQKRQLEEQSKEALTARQAAAEAEKLAKEKQRLERERKRIAQQQHEVNRRAQLVLQEQQKQKHGPDTDWAALDFEEKQQQLRLLQHQAECEKQRQREERDRRIAAECERWLQRTEQTQQLAVQQRTQLQQRLAALQAREEYPEPSPLRRRVSAVIRARQQNSESSVQPAPPPPPPPPVKVNPLHLVAVPPSRAVNPITGFPDPQQLLQEPEEIDGGPVAFPHEADVFRNAVKAAPPTKRPSDYSNYNISLTDGVDHELLQVLAKADAQSAGALARARDRAVLAEKARIAEERALQLVARYREQPKKPLKPSYKPKLQRKMHRVQ